MEYGNGKFETSNGLVARLIFGSVINPSGLRFPQSGEKIRLH